MLQPVPDNKRSDFFCFSLNQFYQLNDGDYQYCERNGNHILGEADEGKPESIAQERDIYHCCGQDERKNHRAEKVEVMILDTKNRPVL